MDLDGEPYSGLPQFAKTGGWYWVRRPDHVALYIKVQGRKRATQIARMLNAAEQLNKLGSPRR